jgi:hypothetical protein
VFFLLTQVRWSDYSILGKGNIVICKKAYYQNTAAGYNCDCVVQLSKPVMF